MFEDLRKQASDESSFQKEEEEQQDTYTLKETKSRGQRDFLGMTPSQRFVIAFMLLMMTCILSTFVLLVAGKIVPPGL